MNAEGWLPSSFELALTGAVLIVSGASWWYALRRWASGLPAIRYRARMQSPWDIFDLGVFIVITVAIAFAALRIATALGGSQQGGPSIPVFLAFGIGELLGAAISIAMIAGRHGIDLRHLGWRPRHLLGDVRMGVATFAAVAPLVFGLQAWLVQIWGPTRHPLIESLSMERSIVGFLIAFLTAVIVAPLVEEVFFRVLLQGSLESWDLRRTAARRPGIWTIVISAACFAAMHYGHGPDPIPIFLLGLALGYLYRQTHRATPCIAMHASLNGCTLLVLWLSGMG